MISTVSEGLTIFIPMTDMVNIKEEIARIDKEIKEKENFIKKSESKLNSEFVNRAPENIVEEERDRLAKYIDEKSKLEERKRILLE